jgi:hypothetical protein
MMIRHIALGLAMLAGAVLGGGAVDRINAQNKAPGAYAVFDISEIADQENYQAHLPRSAPTNDAFGGKFVIRTNNIRAARDGTHPSDLSSLLSTAWRRQIAWSNSSA